eukprot:TRINITY_DN24121_c0_g1_i1.p1 TRINITY_DN24121_c0_g1~~TRINITY_DN24121_c0_g1_i1.p1  ORF type:complete len:351 (+),score=44.83 TRINITY_DN24121_c0_g1_i1:110-1162(+)
MSLGIERIKVDPRQLNTSLHASDIEVSSSCGGFHHDLDWASKICEQLKTHRFALLTLPDPDASLYMSLMKQQTYPAAVNSKTDSVKTCKGHDLPEDLQSLAKSWASICESICKPVAQQLLRWTAPASPIITSAHHKVRGMLRISYNSSAGPHYDNSFVTFMGTGNTTGALQFSMRGAEPEEQGTNVHNGNLFEPCEQFIFAGRDSKLQEETTFLMLSGVRVCSPLDTVCKPLLHRVEYESSTDDVHRINAIYFLRNFEASPSNSSTTQLEIHAFNRTFLDDPNFMVGASEASVADQTDGPSGYPSHSTSEPAVPGAGQTNCLLEQVEQDSSLEQGAVDWNLDDLPFSVDA